MSNPTIGNESQFTPSYSWGNGFSSFDIATQQESFIVGKNPTIGNQSQFKPSYSWGNFSSFDIATQQELLIVGKNPTLENQSQFTPSYSWGNGFSSFNNATQQESLIVGKNPTLDAKRYRHIVEYDLSGKLITNTDESVSQFQSYGRKFLSNQANAAEYNAYGYTPAGTDGYLIKLNSTQQDRLINDNVNTLTMAGTLNSNKELSLKSLTGTGITAAAGTLGIPSVAGNINTLLEQGGLLDPTYSTVPLQNLNNKLANGISLRYIDFRTKKINLKTSDANTIAAAALDKRRDMLSSTFRSNSKAFNISYATLSTVGGGPYTLHNLDTMFGWGSHDNPTAIRSDFTSRSNIATSWDNIKLKEIAKGHGARIGSALHKTSNIIERISPFRGDRVNVIDFNQRKWNDIYQWFSATSNDNNFNNLTEILGSNPYGKTKDFIKFFLTGPKLHAGAKEGTIDDVLVFRATLSQLSDQFSPSWNPVNMIGRADPNYHYGGYTRSVDVSFVVYATDRDELKYIYRKLNGLAGYTAPEYTDDSYAMKGPWCRITIGDLFVSQPVLIESLSYTLTDNDSTWEINLEDDKDMMQVPHKIDVSLGLTMITDYLPEKNGAFYTLSKEINANGKPKQNQDGSWILDTKTVVNQNTEI